MIWEAVTHCSQPQSNALHPCAAAGCLNSRPCRRILLILFLCSPGATCAQLTAPSPYSSDKYLHPAPVRSGECAATFDEHADRIWGLSSGGVAEGLLATGGGDASVVIWEDTTARDVEEAVGKEAELALQEQALQNAIAVRWPAWLRPRLWVDQIVRCARLSGIHGRHRCCRMPSRGVGRHGSPSGRNTGAQLLSRLQYAAASQFAVSQLVPTIISIFNLTTAGSLHPTAVRGLPRGGAPGLRPEAPRPPAGRHSQRGRRRRPRVGAPSGRPGGAHDAR